MTICFWGFFSLVAAKIVFYSLVQKEKQNERFPAKTAKEAWLMKKEDSLFLHEKHAPYSIKHTKIVFKVSDKKLVQIAPIL